MRDNDVLQVNPSDAGIYDRVVVQELIKTIASAQQLVTGSTTEGGQREFKERIRHRV